MTIYRMYFCQYSSKNYIYLILYNFCKIKSEDCTSRT